jgi:hypothetical protein
MTQEFFIQKQTPDITATFVGGGVLAKSGEIWTYERDGRMCNAREPEVALKGAEGAFKGAQILGGKLWQQE